MVLNLIECAGFFADLLIGAGWEEKVTKGGRIFFGKIFTFKYSLNHLLKLMNSWKSYAMSFLK